MSISVSGYMSNDQIIAWMQDKTTDLYTHLRDSMQGADERADAQSALDDIKAALANDKGHDERHVQQMINDALTKYADVPEVVEVLQPMADKLTNELSGADEDIKRQRGIIDALSPALLTLDPVRDANQISAYSHEIAQAQAKINNDVVNLNGDEADAWGKQIDSKLDALGKHDQLAMIDIQELNSEINQAKQTASALLDASDKSTSSIINHIA